MAHNEINERMKSPVGKALWAALKVKDVWEKYDKKGIGQYKVNLALPTDSKECKEFKKALSEKYKAAFEEDLSGNDNSMWYEGFDKETGEATGDTIFKFKIKNKERKDGSIWDRRPFQVDATNHRLNEPMEVGNGSDIRVQFKARSWQTAAGTGIALDIEGVQIINLNY